MHGKVNEALASYEDIIAASPKAIEPRVLAAELYAKDDAGARRSSCDGSLSDIRVRRSPNGRAKRCRESRT
jgi:hypothetical protein